MSVEKPTISMQKFYQWKAKYAGMQVSDGPARTLELENNQLERIVTEQCLNVRVRKEVSSTGASLSSIAVR
ncbi:MAG: hypothetical protein R3E84_10435 [Pseudomonadales bacterium]